jgi:hypothetical protein
VLLGAVDEGAMVIARADDGGATRAHVEATLARFIDSLACAR